MNRLIESGKYVKLAMNHGAPASDCGKEFCCMHKKTFLPWHRIYLHKFEEELGEPLPYWDWTVDKEVPDLWEGIKAPLESSLTSDCNEGEAETFHGVSFATRKKNGIIVVVSHLTFPLCPA